MSARPEAMLVGVVQPEPFQVSAKPPESTATQKPAETQDMPVIVRVESGLAELQAPEALFDVFPASPPPMQKPAAGQESEWKSTPTDSGVLQMLPS